jgi:EAL domain-containing protein (putative c-di-GMP-specific phosphodiesterase class I)
VATDVPTDAPQDGSAHPVIAAADAATLAARDAAATARSAAHTTVSAHDAVVSMDAVASSASQARATTVAAAATMAADIAARAATAVRAEAADRALDVAAAAVAALERIAAELPDDVDPDGAQRVAALVAATVAADVITQAKLTDDAAKRVAQAVAIAAEAAAVAAVAAAAVVNAAVGSAQEVAQEMQGSSRATETASRATVTSTGRVADLAVRRLAQLRQAPMVAALARGLDREELRLHYQPMFDMSTGAAVGVEGLLRWQHPDRGLLPPSEFLEVAEGPALVVPVGDWVLATAVAQATIWQEAYGDAAPVMWVNISCDQLGRRHLVGVVDRLLSQHGLAPARLGIEVTERQLARRVDDIGTDLLELRGLGVSLAVDDFGTGYASLDYLRRFTFDEVKIDRSFIAGIGDRTDEAVISSIIALAGSLGLTMVAEGVETQRQFEFLRLLGCTVSQGYLHQRPASAETIDAVLRREARGRTPGELEAGVPDGVPAREQL